MLLCCITLDGYIYTHSLIISSIPSIEKLPALTLNYHDLIKTDNQIYPKNTSSLSLINSNSYILYTNDQQIKIMSQHSYKLYNISNIYKIAKLDQTFLLFSSKYVYKFHLFNLQLIYYQEIMRGDWQWHQKDHISIFKNNQILINLLQTKANENQVIIYQYATLFLWLKSSKLYILVDN